MNLRTRVLMSASAAFMAVLGIGITFLPHEVLDHVGVVANQAIVLLMQMLGALYLGFAALNWMSRGNHIGGIYSRPLAIANLFAFLVAAVALLKAAVSPNATIQVIAFAIIYAVFAIWFGLVAFTHPANETD